MIRTLLRSFVCLLLSACLSFSHASPVGADAGRFLTSPSAAELQAEIESLSAASAKNPTPEQRARLEDLNLLALAIGRSDDRAQLRNDSAHNIGLYLRYKKDPPSTPASLSVLGPAQESDDDFELVGLYIPAAVTVQWQQGGQAAADGPRVARVLEGQRLLLGDGVVDSASPTSGVGYSLNLPIFAFLDPKEATTIVAEVPSLSQADLDGQPANAPTD
jgi:hypothetical protein